jgi:hypothetical protein
MANRQAHCRQRLAGDRYRVELKREQCFQRDPDSDPGAAAIAGTFARLKQHLEIAKQLRCVQRPGPTERQGDGEGGRKRGDCISRRSQSRADKKYQIERRRSEHQYRLQQLPAAHRAQSRQRQQMPVFEIAGQPAKFPALELGQGGRGGLGRTILFR